MKPLWIAAGLIVSCGALRAQSAPEPERKGGEPGRDSSISVQFKDGLLFKTSDGNFDAKLGGWIISHLRSVVDRPDGRTSADTFYQREVSLAMEGVLYRQFDFKLESNFAPSAASVLDVWLGWRKVKELSFRFGNFKQPFSQEETTSLKYIDFVEKSVLNRLAPARSLGFMAYGSLGEGLFSYEASIHNGEVSNTSDTNDEKDVALRLRVNPFLGGEGAFKDLRLGVMGTRGNIDDLSAGAGSATLDVTTTELGATFLDAGLAGVAVDGPTHRLGLELSWIYGPYSLRAEWARRVVEVDGPLFADEEIASTAWYLAFTWVLTGEPKTLEKGVKPAASFDVDKGDWGALELTLRLAGLEADDALFDLGVAGAAANAEGVRTFTAGLNWWMTQNFRLSPNFVLERYEDDVTFLAGRREDSLFGALLRVEIVF